MTTAADLVTPVVLTYNEEDNVERTLGALQWARCVVVVDSGSTDATEQLAKRFSNVRWFVRPFDTHGQQWTFAIRGTNCIVTPYVIALDADYEVPPAFVRELATEFASRHHAGGIAGFEYRVGGRALMGSVYPAKLVMFRPDEVRVSQPGHSQEFHVDGPLFQFRTRLIHDDRKSIDRFLRSQIAYSHLEANRLLNGSPLRWQDHLRRIGVMPIIAGVGAYLRSGGPFRGRASLRYAYERTLFESLLALRLLALAFGPGPARGVSDEEAAERDRPHARMNVPTK